VRKNLTEFIQAPREYSKGHLMSEQKDIPLVLVADDEVHTTIMLARIFEREGYQVQSVHDGAAAVNAAQHLLPDLILLDVQMPVMNGFDALRSLRENSLTANIPTIIITAKARQPSDVAHGLNLGADDFVHKPFDPRELLARAESKIRARKLEDALQRRSQELEALLRVGEELNQHLEVKDLLNLVPYLVLDLLPGHLSAIYHLDDNRNLIQVETHTKDGSPLPDQIDHQAITQNFLQGEHSVLWPGDSVPQVDSFSSGMIVPLKHGDSLLGMLLLVTQTGFYDENHLRLFEGIGGQAALALRNAQLYEIQANYALHLEDMVEAKTAELQSAQQMLIRAEKLASIGHLAASIAHEINNPLQPIRIVLEDMLEDLQNNAPIDVRALQITHENVERIWRIVSQLLDFAGKRSTTSPDLQLIDIGQIIEGVVSLNKKFFQKEEMRIISNLDTPLPVYGNKDQLEQVFMNLILNAKAAMETGGTLKIQVKKDNGEIIAQFIDTGCGIAPDRINKIFDPFFSTKPNGTGLGLFVSYGIIQSHHGSIEVKSKVNKGTTFTIRLPMYVDNPRT
jgi:two-component system, NtrC family, sensor kinase